VRSGPGAPGLGPMSQRGELVVFKQGVMCCSNAPQRCAEACVRVRRLPQPSVLRQRVRGRLRALVESAAACCGTVSNNNACARLGVATRSLVNHALGAIRRTLQRSFPRRGVAHRPGPRPQTVAEAAARSRSARRAPTLRPTVALLLGYWAAPNLLRIAAFRGVNDCAQPARDAYAVQCACWGAFEVKSRPPACAASRATAGRAWVVLAAR
jgi:hypothetical protein